MSLKKINNQLKKKYPSYFKTMRNFMGGLGLCFFAFFIILIFHEKEFILYPALIIFVISFIFCFLCFIALPVLMLMELLKNK